MATSNFLDANILLALLWGRHIHSETARTWIEQSSGDEFYFCRLTQLTVLRLLTTEKIMGKDTRTMAEAWDAWDQLLIDSLIDFLPEPPTLEQELRSRSQLSGRSPKVWADAYLSAFALLARLRLVTFGRALKVRGADVLVL
jgi:uncharacterized protein